MPKSRRTEPWEALGTLHSPEPSEMASPNFDFMVCGLERPARVISAAVLAIQGNGRSIDCEMGCEVWFDWMDFGEKDWSIHLGSFSFELHPPRSSKDRLQIFSVCVDSSPREVSSCGNESVLKEPLS